MNWPILATVLICCVFMAGAFVSVIENVLFHRETFLRNMGCFSELKLDCRGSAPSKWAKVIHVADNKWRETKVPIRAFAFADYSNANEVVCENGSCIDYGVAIGYAKEGRKGVSYQLSYVLHSEKAKGAARGTSSAKKRENLLWSLTRMLILLAKKDPSFSGMEVDAPFIAHRASRFFPDEEDFLATCWVPQPSEDARAGSIKEEHSSILKEEVEAFPNAEVEATENMS